MNGGSSQHPFMGNEQGQESSMLYGHDANLYDDVEPMTNDVSPGNSNWERACERTRGVPTTAWGGGSSSGNVEDSEPRNESVDEFEENSIEGSSDELYQSSVPSSETDIEEDVGAKIPFFRNIGDSKDHMYDRFDDCSRPVWTDDLTSNLEARMIFQTKDLLKHAVQCWSVRSHRYYKVRESTPSSWYVRCIYYES